VIDSRRLRTLRAVADHGTVTAAAAVLFLTPSAVSQQIAALEAEVGQRLLVRNGRGVRLTTAGRILLEHGTVVLARLELAEAELAAYANGLSGQVDVVSFATGITTVVAPAMADLGRTLPGIRVRVQDAEGDASLAMVLDGHADIAIAVEYRGAPGEDDRRLARVPLFAEPFDAILPCGHPSAGDPAVAVASLAAEAWISPRPGNPCHDVVVLACEQAGFQPRLAHFSDDFRAVAALVGTGAGVALVPRSALRGVDLRDVVSRPVTGASATRRVFAAVRRGTEGHPLLGPVLAALATAAGQAHVSAG
jgi:DNA-binding transcriptional LysR family regulator